MIVTRIRDIAPDVREFELRAADGSELPWYEPGSHIGIEHEAGERPEFNAYSLTDSGIAPQAYRISVLRCGHTDDAGATGGSDWLHDNLTEGTQVRVQGPVSAFRPVPSARNHLLIAVGIGITPILSHLRAARHWGRPITVLYGYSPTRAPHLDELCAEAGDNLRLTCGRAEIAEATAELMSAQPMGTYAYACGPAGYLEDFEKMAAALGWPEDRVRVEHFAGLELDAGDPFTVTVSSTGERIDVPSGVSLLDALDSHGVTVPNMCRQGVCGQCRVRIASGRAVHRDMLTTDAQRQQHSHLYACVSRGVEDTLEVAL
ncbi:PDR/VanB family oxidoreductase [Gordonia jinhuaensis]|uniref:Ferredoxin n=1 Tax=Gordonia jinhuaensis TaxID=1517702 RepID=A0A916WSX9_9ACTN|nr:PDR/VanB family oxidoreductase [Gordonia jinhuaensis]GGB27612.1 ferredoxin [Gordonia jinhuaensis]